MFNLFALAISAPRSFALFRAVSDGCASVDREEVYAASFSAIFDSFLHARAFRFRFAFHIDDESQIRMQIMMRIYMFMPWLAFDLKSGFGNSTNEAHVLNLSLDFCILGSFVSERVNDDTKENVQENNVDTDEEQEVKEISAHVICTCDQRLLDGISDTTASSHAVVERGQKAVEQCIAVHVVWRSVRIIWPICCLVLGAEAFEGQESEDVDNDYQKGES
jgi:hypothetical protein